MPAVVEVPSETASERRMRKLREAVIRAAGRFREHETTESRFALFEAVDALNASVPERPA